MYDASFLFGVFLKIDIQFDLIDGRRLSQVFGQQFQKSQKKSHEKEFWPCLDQFHPLVLYRYFHSVLFKIRKVAALYLYIFIK